MTTDLELATTDALLRELCSRFDCALFAGLKTTTPEDELVENVWVGHSITCVGMADNIKSRILRDYERSLKRKRA